MTRSNFEVIRFAGLAVPAVGEGGCRRLGGGHRWLGGGRGGCFGDCSGDFTSGREPKQERVPVLVGQDAEVTVKRQPLCLE